MSTARGIMNAGIKTMRKDQSLADASAMMRDLGVGSLPVQSADGALTGIITDRDIVVRACAEGRDLTSTPAGELAQGIVATIGPDEPVETIVDLMGTVEDQIHHFVKMVYGRD